MQPTTPGHPSIHNEAYLLDLLKAHGLLTAQQIEQITIKKHQQRTKLLRQQQTTNKQRTTPPDLIDIIVSLHFDIKASPGQELTEETIIRQVGKDQNLPFKKLDPLELDLKTVTKTIPQPFALKHLLLPFAIKNGVLDVAIYDPANIQLLQDIERANQIKIQPHLTTKSDIQKILGEFFGFQSSISAAETNLKGPEVDLGNLEQYVNISSSAEIASSDQHIKGAVDHLFNYAFEQRASDIHIEPKRNTSVIRLRIDGVLHTIYNLPKVVHPALISRIKSLSRLDIAEKRRPQDGRIKVNRSGDEAEIRVSTVPVAFGEKAVLRILDPHILFQDLTHIGFSAHDLAIYQDFISAPHGLVLVTGPTGSGKSTTLYSTLKNIATPEKNIITVEDPVEMIHEEFNQISVQSSADVTFSTILRNILRQDPDIIMIGEIRDLDTAHYAVQAALTGHLVFSTLHTNDAVSSITRLTDLGLQPFLIASTLLGAMAQRLVRTICPHCIEDFIIDASELGGFGFPSPPSGPLTLKRGKGCQQCRGTGYLGRCGIFEIFPMSESIKQMTSINAPVSEIRTMAIREGMTPLMTDAWQKITKGITTYEEAIRITGSC
ncbi:MAG: GspE/PulE family protein [Proteobacteria bacterium]|nr:type II/IV secretion system protein [Desulfobulbaceae bacterium]MBU4153612.1 GspE/PulE family protein [Pseudomonadota bacterium]